MHATEAQLLVTDRRVAVAQRDRVRLDVPFDRLRRIQFDIERARPATLVIVPEHPRDEPQVLAIPREHIGAAANVLAFIGELLLHPMGRARRVTLTVDPARLRSIWHRPARPCARSEEGVAGWNPRS